jgi:tripartite-type tricarboxylate transporter receptor subunit TctC
VNRFRSEHGVLLPSVLVSASRREVLGSFALALARGATGAVGLVLVQTVAAQRPAPVAWPTKPIRLIVPVGPGGGVDLVGRLVAEQLSKVLGQAIFVENMGGAGGTIGSLATARAAPDGHTLMVGYVGTHGTNPALRKLNYDALADFSAIAMVGGTPNVLVVAPGFPAQDFKQFAALMKADGDKLSYATSGPGTLTHLIMEQLKGALNSNAVHVPYKGIGPALIDVLGGQVPMACPGLAAALPHIKAGKLRALALTGAQRHRLMPETPTFEELGLRGFDGVQWYGIVGPAKMPADIVKRLNTEINKIINTSQTRERLSAEALEPMPMSSGQFAAFIAQDISRWAKVGVARGIRLD